MQSLQNKIAENFLKALEKLSWGRLIVHTPEAKIYEFVGKNSGSTANLYLHNWQTVTALMTKADVGFTEAYRDGWWETDDIVSLLTIGLQNQAHWENTFSTSFFSRLLLRCLYFMRRNSLAGSKRNIHQHYDLGNDFYQLWLDESMTYSSALFTNVDQPLKDAQMNKYDRILNRLSQSGDVLEVGCGWGGFIEHALKKKDYQIKGITLSEQQLLYARNRLGSSAQIVMEDYRKQHGKFQHIVSIEMFEAVGEKFWPVYFAKIKSLLHKSGKAMIQTITIGDEFFARYRKGIDMIRTFIFPGGMLPSLQCFRHEVTKAGLKVTDTFSFGDHYKTTLQQWLQTFNGSEDAVYQLGFDEKFVRIWRFYLAACIAGFSAKRTNVFQIEVQHA